MVYNAYQREIAAPVSEVGPLIDSLASRNDRLWPRSEWPSMRLNGPLGVGAAGGHGPVRYFVTAYEPSRRIEFQFTGPFERKMNELREARPSKPKHAADRGRDTPELGDGTKPKPPERGPSLGR